jgi:hypothetical protein
MSVINVKVKYIRPEYNNLEEWMQDENNVYIGRKGIVFINNQRFPLESSPFANPFKITSINSREIVLEQYEIYIREKIETGAVSLLELQGKTLGCWCHPEPCHGDILLRLIEEYE